MACNIKKLGDYIELVDIRNIDCSNTNLQGVSISKEFIPSIANMVGVDIAPYKVVKTGQFAYGPVTSRNGDKISVALLKGPDCIISSSYTPFEVTKTDELLPEYLMLWFRRPEFDRYARFKSHGSAREIFDWEQMCQVELPIPSVEEQQKIVDAYNTIQTRIELKKKINENLAATADALFQKFFVQNDECKLWDKANFSNFIVSTTGGDWGQETPSGNYIEQVSCIRGTDIPQLNLGSIADAPTRYILTKNFSSKRIKADNLVVEISGGSPVQATGRIALVPEKVLKYRGDKIICSNFCRVVEVNPDYLYFFLQYWMYLYRNGRMFDYENSSTGLKNFDFTSFVEKETIVMPPFEIARQFNKLAAPIYAEIFNAGFEIQHLIDTKEHILPKLMTKGF